MTGREGKRYRMGDPSAKMGPATATRGFNLRINRQINWQISR
jgi:hypothetical protein